jgi:hypothetical protein
VVVVVLGRVVVVVLDVVDVALDVVVVVLDVVLDELVVVLDVVLDVVVCAAPPQVTPLTLNEVGLGLLPDQVPWNPMLVEPPLAIAPFQAALVAVTVLPDWLHEPADQPLVYFVVVSGKSNFSVQLVQASPMFLMVMFAVNPPCQSLLWYCTSQLTAASAGVAGRAAIPPNAIAPPAAMATIRLLVCLTPIPILLFASLAAGRRLVSTSGQGARTQRGTSGWTCAYVTIRSNRSLPAGACCACG